MDKLMEFQIKSLEEAIWRNHYQIVVSDINDTGCEKPLYYGSAFMFIYKGTVYVVTADHVINAHDYEVCAEHNRNGVKYNYFLINNINQELSTILTPIGGFFYFEKINLSEYDNEFIKEITNKGMDFSDFFEKIDVAITKMQGETPYFLTHELCASNGDLIVEKGLGKLFLSEENCTTPNSEDSYYIYGVVHNDVDDIRYKRCNAMYSELNFDSCSDGIIQLKYNEQIKYEDWAALSGSAVFNQTGNVIGMAIRVHEDTSIVDVVPIDTITHFINLAIDYEKHLTNGNN